MCAKEAHLQQPLHGQHSCAAWSLGCRWGPQRTPLGPSHTRQLQEGGKGRNAFKVDKMTAQRLAHCHCVYQGPKGNVEKRGEQSSESFFTLVERFGPVSSPNALQQDSSPNKHKRRERHKRNHPLNHERAL